MRNRLYLTVDASTGFIVCRHSVPATMFPPADVAPGQKIVAAEDNAALPPGKHRFDLRKLRRDVNVVPSFVSALSTWRAPALRERAKLDIARMDAIDALDRRYARLMNQQVGPLAALHAEKRRQAGAGAYDPETMPLVADEADRRAILSNAAAQDERVAAIERERRAVKARVKAANSQDEIKAALAADAFPEGGKRREEGKAK